MCDEIPNNIKLRFKGVENFLRKIAFNLGNSPSQTEVKIISCIPIDVTDLQQKICDLERVIARFQKPPAIVHTALCEPGPSDIKERRISDTIKGDTSPVNEQKTLTYGDTPKTEVVNQIAEENVMQRSPGSSLITVLSDDSKNLKKNFFRKSRMKSAKKKLNRPKNQMVYYAQTDNSPFKPHNLVDKKTTNMKKETKDRKKSFLADIIRKQYEPLMYQLSGESDFSSPVCRDIEYSCFPAATTASDICSCCRMDFLNIDKNKTNDDFGFTPTFRDQINSQNMYYDSSLYDLVPVKEAPVKANKIIEMSKTKKRHKNDFEFSNYFDYYGDRPYAGPVYVNYHTVVPTKPRAAPSLPRRTPRKTLRSKPQNRRIDVCNEADETFQEDTSNSCRIECGNVYKKPLNKKPDPPKIIQVQQNRVTYNDAETATLNNTECQTITTTQNVEIDSTPSDDKTEETLNQIKTILQSVLTEVKTNSKLKNVPEEKVKKDAVVQKGASLGNMPGSSRLINSFSYGAYNAGPYGPSCSHQINSAQHWPSMPYPPKCTHNFPVFIQTPGRLPYATCFRKTSHMSKSSTPPRQATSAATNTEDRNYETEKLIKEIYKSIALNIDVPKKENSSSNCSSAWKHSSRASTKSSLRTDKSVSARQGFVNSMAQSPYRRDSISAPLTELGSSTISNKRREAMNSVPLTPFSSNTFSNKMTSNTVSVQSHAISSTETDRRMRYNRRGNYLDTTEEIPSEESAIKRNVHPERRPLTTTTVESSSEESDDTQVTQYQMNDAKTEIQKKERTNLFTKMIKSVKLFKNRKRKSQKSKTDSTEEEESDSDDYQTVYSQQLEQARRAPVQRAPVQRAPIQVHLPSRRVPHSKVSYSRQMRGRNQEKLRRSPMEQEYRRQWAEQLMYQQRPRYSTEQSERSYRSAQRQKQPYAPRPIMVEQSIPVQNTMFQDVLTTLPQQRTFRRPLEPARTGPPKGLSWFKKRMRCGEHIVRSLIVNN